MIVFQVSLNFDPAVKEILKTILNLYLMKKVIVLKKIQMTMK